MSLGGFPGGSVIENLPANAGGKGLIPAKEDLIWCGATEPMYHNYRSPSALEPVLHKKSLCTTTLEQPPLTPTREKTVQQQRPGTAKK